MSFNPSDATLGVGSPYDPIILAASARYVIDPALIKAVITKESSWNPGALRVEPQINDASYGLMQLLQRTAAGMQPGVTPSDLFDPSINIDLGTRYLSGQVNRYGLPDGISAYNAGHPISGNAQYVADVLAAYSWFSTNDPAVGGAGGAPFREQRTTLRLAPKPHGGHGSGAGSAPGRVG
jgi:soluble lytic murein transglycosylase-like protein